MFGGEVKYTPKRRGEAKNTLAENSTLRKLGWLPKKNIKDYINKFKNEHK